VGLKQFSCDRKERIGEVGAAETGIKETVEGKENTIKSKLQRREKE